MIKRFIAFFLITATAAVYSDACAHETPHKPDFSRVGKITIAVYSDFQPYCFPDETGEHKGIMIDLWKLWSEKTGIRIGFVPGTAKELTDMIRNGKVDVHTGLIYSKQRDAFCDYTRTPIVRLSSTFFYHKTIFGLKTLNDLSGFKIGIIKGRYGEDYVREHLPNAALAPYPTLSDMIDGAEKGIIRVFVAPIENIRWILKSRGILSEFQHDPINPLFTENMYPAVTEGNAELARIVEHGMTLITPDERAAIEQKWMGESVVKTKDTLIIAMGNDYPPLFFVNEQGESAGMFPDIWRLWSRKTGQKIEFHPDTFSESLEHLRTDKADVHTGLHKSRERETWIDFFDPMYESRTSLVVPIRYGRFSSLGELSGHPVGAISGTVQEIFLKQHYPNITVVPCESLRKMIVAAREGSIHAFISVSVLTNEMISRLGLSGEFESMEETLFPVTFHVGIRKENPELYARIQKGFDAISYQEMADIESRWIQDPAKRYFSSKISQIKLTEEERAWIRQHPVVNFGISTGYAPFTYVGKHGKPDGIVMDYIELLRKKTGMKFRVDIAKPWIDLMPMIRENAIDGVAFASRTAERDKYMLFTDNYIVKPWVIVTRSDFQGIDLKPTDLGGKKVAVLKTSPAEEMLRGYPNIILVSLPTVEQIWDAVSSGQADAGISGLASASYYIGIKGIMNLKVAGVLEDRVRFGSGIRKDLPELVAILNKAIAAITPEEHQAIEKKWVSLRYETGVDWRIVYRWLLLIGSVSGVIIILTLVWNRRLAKEIETRRRAEENLSEKQKLLEIVTEMIPDIVYLYNTQEKRHIYINKELASVLGYSSEEIKTAGSDFILKNIHPEDLPGVLKHIELLAHTRSNACYNVEYRIKGVNDNYLWFYVSEQVYRKDQNQNPEILFGICQDITERKNAEKERAKLESRLRQAQSMESIGTLAGGIAHDFNNILFPIIGYTEMTSDDLPRDSRAYQNLQEVLKASLRAKELVNQILTFSRQRENEKIVMKVQPVIKEALKLIRSTLPTTIELSQSIDPNCNPVMADPTQIHQIMMNLCTNAFYAMQDNGGKLEVSLAEVGLGADDITAYPDAAPGTYLKLSVSDTGIGIPKDILARIFDPFFTTKPVGRGTGLGLSVVHGIVKQMGGHIGVYSEPGKGTVFHVLMPAVTSETVPISDPSAVKEIVPTGSERILLVDDEEPILGMLRQMLEELGYRVTPLAGSSEAFNVFRNEPDSFDLVITDMTMPDMTGAQLARKILEIRADMPIILCTGFSEQISGEKSEKLGIRGYLMKPVIRTEMAKMIRKVLGG